MIDLASYRAMTHTNDAHTVHTCQTRSVCKPRPPAYIQGPACIQGPASIGTITSDPRPLFEARLVFKARLLFEEIRYFNSQSERDAHCRVITLPLCCDMQIINCPTVTVMAVTINSRDGHDSGSLSCNGSVCLSPIRLLLAMQVSHFAIVVKCC